MKAKNCGECKHFNFIPVFSDETICGKGHHPRFYKPKHERDGDWGWKRRCEDFERPSYCEHGNRWEECDTCADLLGGV